MEKINLTDINIDEIFLDPENPRIPRSIHGQDQLSILRYMFENSAVTELIESIGENGFFPGEPIILVKESDKYKVVEGNRRVSALKLMRDPDLAKIISHKLYDIVMHTKKKPVLIPSLVTLSDKELQKFLGFRHVTGVKNWNALEKARYLDTLKNSLLEAKSSLLEESLYAELARSIGSRASYVKRILQAYELYKLIEDNHFFGVEGLNDTNFPFVNLSDSLSRSSLAKFLGVEGSSGLDINPNLQALEEWTKWLFEKNSQNITRLKGTSSDLTKFSEIVAMPEALNAFRNGATLDDAVLLTKHIDFVFDELIKKAVFYLKEADNVVHNIHDFSDDLESDLKEIAGLCKKINTIRKSRGDDDFDV